MGKVFIYDEFGPQDVAMMQALYSRSPQSVTEHAEKVRQSGSGKFMEKFYVGYGHLSIADCGSTTLFIEGISILADKAIQDWQMYSGQETSTRYIDMSKQPIIDPVGSDESKKILDAWMDFYISSQEKVGQHLKEKYPRKADEDEGVYEKAVKARTFDILRGFLPAGITTQLSWHTNLRQAWDKLSLMRHHPLAEVRETAEQMLSGLKEKYPHSFSHPLFEEQEKYREYATREYSYFVNENPCEFEMKTTVLKKDIVKHGDLLFWRPFKTGLPNFLGELGTFTFDFLLDFGSFRDIQRHRNGVCRMPLLTTKLGFHHWYIEQLPNELREKALKLIENQKTLIDQLDASDEVKQYYTAMGFNVSCRVTYGLPATTYVIELRSNRTVHPSLREVAHKMHRAVMEKFPQLRLQSDLSLDDWDVRRGLQDITQKN